MVAVLVFALVAAAGLGLALVATIFLVPPPGATGLRRGGKAMLGKGASFPMGVCLTGVGFETVDFVVRSTGLLAWTFVGNFRVVDSLRGGD